MIEEVEPRADQDQPSAPRAKVPVSWAFATVTHDAQGEQIAYAPRKPGHVFESRGVEYAIGAGGEVRRPSRSKLSKKQRRAARRAARTGGS